MTVQLEIEINFYKLNLIDNTSTNGKAIMRIEFNDYKRKYANNQYNLKMY